MVLLAIWIGAVGVADLVRWTSKPQPMRLAAAAIIGSGMMVAIVWASGFTFTDGIEYVLPAAVALVVWLTTSAAATPPRPRTTRRSLPLSDDGCSSRSPSSWYASSG